MSLSGLLALDVGDAVQQYVRGAGLVYRLALARTPPLAIPVGRRVPVSSTRDVPTTRALAVSHEPLAGSAS